MTRVIAFDVNETLLDLRALDPPFEELLGSAALRGQWFAQMLQLSFVGGLTGEYVDFSTAQAAALRMLAEGLASRRPISRSRRWSTGWTRCHRTPKSPGRCVGCGRPR
jgi:2-haloacid dehalogenase